jgi:hypothetical protein
MRCGDYLFLRDKRKRRQFVPAAAFHAQEKPSGPLAAARRQTGL